MRISRIVQLVALMLLALLVAAGCGGGGDSTDTGDARKASDTSEPAKDDGSEAEEVEADLQVKLTNMGDKTRGAGIPIPTGIRCTKSIPATCTAELACPAAERADDGLCAWLAATHEEVFAEPAKDLMCTEIYGGPEVARVTGTIEGEEIDVTFSRTNGCEIGRWDAAAPLWTREVSAANAPGAGGGGATPPAIAGMCVAEDPDKPVSSDNPPVDCEDTVVTPQPDEIVDPPEAFDS